MKTGLLGDRLRLRVALKLLTLQSLMPSLEVRSLGRQRVGAPRTAPGRAGSQGLPLLLIAAATVVLGGCGPSRAPAPQTQTMSVALMPPPTPTPGPDYHVQLGDTLKVAFLYQPENDIDLVVR